MHDHEINQEVSTAILREWIKEKRAERRWRIFRFIFIALIIVLIVLAASMATSPSLSGVGNNKDYVALLRLNGTIAPGQEFSAENVIPLLENAFTDNRARGVILDIDSGGGTPVQASIIHDAVVRLKKKYHKKVVVVGEDLLASGAYYVAVAADKIYVNPNTITGSIGVIMKGFGFTDLLKKTGVERRVYTSGENKDRLDPFLPQTEADKEKIKQVIAEVHGNFDAIVLEGRKGKLHGDPKELFSGDFWSGMGALRLGLVDNLGNLSDAMQQEFNVTHYKDYSGVGSPFKSLFGQLGASFDKAFEGADLHLWEKVT